MKPSLHLWFLCLLAGLFGALGLQVLDAHGLQERARAQWASDLQSSRARLQKSLESITAQCQGFAAGVGKVLTSDEQRLTALAAPVIAAEPLIRNVIISRGLKAFYVHPLAGNESVLGLNYRMRPEFLASVTRASRTSETVFDVPVRLIQTGRDGLIARNAIFAPSDSAAALASPERPASAPALWGLVGCVVDLQTLLQAAGLPLDDPLLHLSIYSESSSRPLQAVWGQALAQGERIAQVQVTLSDSTWLVSLSQMRPLPYPAHRLAALLLAMPVLGAALLWAGTRRRGPRPWLAPGAASTSTRLGLRSVLLLAVAVAVPLLVGVSAWLSFRASIGASEVLEQGQAAELAHRLRDRTQAFFAVPHKLVSYNAEQFRAGQLSIGDEKATVRDFLLQMRQQEWLTFLSVGLSNGAYYAASRAPRDPDKALRVLEASAKTGWAMQIQRVNQDYEGVGDMVIGNPHFQAKRRDWYRGGVQRDALHWYPIYRYAVDDPLGWYDDLGVGMSAPLYDARQRFLGVLTADVALSQLSAFLQAQMQPLGGQAFLIDGEGLLVASSGQEALFTNDAGKITRLRAADSATALVRISAQSLEKHPSPEGQQRMASEGSDYLLHWDRIDLPDGPSFTLAVVQERSRFDGPARQTLQQVLGLTLAFGLLGLVVALGIAQRLARPLLALHGWALQLAQGQWSAAPLQNATVREIAELAQALSGMAARLRAQTAELEQRVAERTAELETANAQLQALAHTDGLTGIANRRQFDEALEREFTRAQRSGVPLALLMCDVDHFKAYNDHYGHQAGDEVLRSLAQLLAAQARRAGDLAARYGGEEFVLLLPETDAASAAHIAQALRQSLQARAMAHAMSAIGHVSVSVGLAVTTAAQPSASAQALLQSADQALYRAKAQGRDRVVLAEG